MIIWDTNIIYYVTGISTLDMCDTKKVISYANTEGVCISSISVY